MEAWLHSFLPPQSRQSSCGLRWKRWDTLEPMGAADSRTEDKQKVGTDFTIFEIVLGLETNTTFCPPIFFLSSPASTSVAQKQTHRWSHFNVTSVLQLDPPHTTPISSPVGEVLWFLTSLSCDVSRWYSCAMIHVYIVLEHPTCLARVGDH